MVDCASTVNGCQGGDICLLLEWLVSTKTVVEFEDEYPLRLTDGLCRIKANTTQGYKIKSYTCME